MSVGRKVKLPIDLDIMEEAACDLNLQIYHKKQVQAWSTRMMDECDLVVGEKDNHYEVGFRKDPVTGETEMLYDAHSGEAEEYLKPLMVKYYEKKINKKARTRVVSRVETKEKIQIYYQR